MKLKQKLITNYLAVTLITLFFVGFAVLRGIRNLGISTIEKQLIDQSKLAEIYISQIHILENGDSDQISLQTATRVISKLGLVLGNVRIYDKSLALQAASKAGSQSVITQNENQRVLSEALKGQYAYIVKRGTAFFASPINVNEMTIGILEIIYPMSFLEKLIAGVTDILLVGAFIFVIIVTLLSVVTADRLTRPINRLAEATRSYAERRFAPVEIKGSDEISQLSRSFNRMGSQLQDYIRRQKLFVSNVSHELKTPLTAIKGYSEILAEEVGNRPDLEKAVYHLKNESARLEKLVDEVLTLSRIDADNGGFQFEKLDLSFLMGETIDKMRIRADKYGIRIVREITPGIVIEGDREKLVQVIVNLLDNAFKFSGSGSTVWIEAYKTYESAVIDIIDEGIGIPQKDLSKVFERFYRADNAGGITGTGLGLSIVKHIIDSHKGSIELSSGTQKGTTVTIKFPLSKE